jgi:hypothetical protein
MVVQYTIAGQKIGSHWVCYSFVHQHHDSSRVPSMNEGSSTGPGVLHMKLRLIASVLQLSIATLSTFFVGSWAMMGGKKTEPQRTPPINAGSKDEENFIQYANLQLSLSRFRFCSSFCSNTDQHIREFLKSAEAEENKGNAKNREGH